MNVFKQFANTGEWFIDLDGKRIARKSIWEARVYDEKYNNLITYKSRLEHCGSCLTDAEYGYGMDECCCIHSSFHSKKQENDYVESTGFWKIPFKQS